MSEQQEENKQVAADSEPQEQQKKPFYPKKEKKNIPMPLSKCSDFSYEEVVKNCVSKHIVKAGEGPVITPGSKVYFKGYTLVKCKDIDEELMYEDKRLQEFAFSVDPQTLKTGFLPVHNVMFKTMQKGEEAVFKVSPQYAYEGLKNMLLTIKQQPRTIDSIEYLFYYIIVTKLEWKRPNPVTWQQKLDCSVADREDAKKFYFEKNFEKALGLYKQALLSVDQVNEELQSADYKKMQLERAVLILNIAKAVQAMGRHSECIATLDRLINKLDAQNKYKKKGEALYIRAISQRLYGYPERAIDDLKLAKELEFNADKIAAEETKAKDQLRKDEEVTLQNSKNIMKKVLKDAAPLYKEKTEAELEQEWAEQEKEDKKKGINRWYLSDGTEFSVPSNVNYNA